MRTVNIAHSTLSCILRQFDRLRHCHIASRRRPVYHVFIANDSQGLIAMDLGGAKRPSGSCCGSMPWADTGSAWATRSRGPARAAGPTADVPILGDLSSRHARIRRDGEGYLIEALREVRVDGRPVRRWAGSATAAGSSWARSVRLLFRQPHPLSATARLDFLSRHRTQPSSDAVLLMADACVLGPEAAQPRRLPRLDARSDPLSATGRAVLPHAPAAFEIDGVVCDGCGPDAARNSRVEGEGFSFNLEAVQEGITTRVPAPHGNDRATLCDARSTRSVGCDGSHA